MRAAIIPGAQTERRGDAGPVRGLLGGKDRTGRFFRHPFAGGRPSPPTRGPGAGGDGPGFSTRPGAATRDDALLEDLKPRAEALAGGPRRTLFGTLSQRGAAVSRSLVGLRIAPKQFGQKLEHDRLLSVCVVRMGHVPGAQTERRGDAGPVRGLFGGKDLTSRFIQLFIKTMSRSGRAESLWLRLFIR